MYTCSRGMNELGLPVLTGKEIDPTRSSAGSLGSFLFSAITPQARQGGGAPPPPPMPLLALLPLPRRVRGATAGCAQPGAFRTQRLPSLPAAASLPPHRAPSPRSPADRG